MFPGSHLAFVAALLGANATQPQAERPMLLVLDLAAERGIDDSLVRLLNELLLTEFGRAGRYRVIGGSDIQGMLEVEQQKQLLGCEDSQCLAQIGGALGADFLATSNIGRIGDYFLLNVKILNVTTVQIVERWSEQVEGVENELMVAVRRSVATVTGQPPPDMPATTGALATATESTEFRAAPITLWVVGGVGVLAGVFFGLQSKNHSDKAASTAVTQVEAREEVDSSRSSALLSNVGYGIGLVAGVTGLVLFLREDSSHPAISVALTGPGNTPGLSVALSF